MFIVMSVMGGRTVKVSDRLFAELKSRKVNLSFSKYIQLLLVHDKEHLGEPDLEKYPRMVVDYDQVASLGRAGIPIGIKYNQKCRTDKYGVPLSEGYEG